MKMNPFLEKAKKVDSLFMSWKDLAPKPYDKNSVDPFTRVRCILMNGTEYEAVWSKHHLHRHCDNNDVRREIAMVRRSEQQQQKLISMLKPIDENILETTIGYEQLAVDLTAILAQRAKNKDFKEALNFALLEDFDHLYRYANLMESDMGAKAENYVGSYTEIMPGRPTIAHHRCPKDSVKPFLNFKLQDPLTRLDVGIITAAEQQTMNYYMNIGGFYKNKKGRELYGEIGMVEEQHVTQYGSFMDPNCSMLENNLMHEYTECYLYYSMYCDESDPNIKKIWERLFEQEVSHLAAAVKLLKKYEKKDWQQIIPKGEFPELIKFRSNKEYIRNVLGRTISLTADLEGYADIKNVPADAGFFKYQAKVNKKPLEVASHLVIEDHISRFGQDYRKEDKESPVKELRDRKKDNISLGRTK